MTLVAPSLCQAAPWLHPTAATSKPPSPPPSPPPPASKMSYPPPPGTGSSSLPPRPPPRPYPPSAHSSASPSPAPSFSGFRPRQVTGPSPMAPQPYAQQQQPQYPPHNTYPGAYPAPSYNSTPTSSTPHIINPFPLPHAPSYAPSRRSDPRYPDLDPELQAQIAQQQSIYDPSTRQNTTTTTTSSLPSTATSKGPTVIGPAADEYAHAPPSTGGGGAKPKNAPTVLRQGGGQVWSDSTLLEWDPSHFRLFVGNLAGEVTDDSLLKAFAKYGSVQKARVIRDKRTTKSKGYGFVAFSDGDEYFRAAREMNGKYIGSHPVLLKRSNTEIKPVVVGGKKRGEGGGVVGGRVEKKKKKKKMEERTVLG